MEHRVTPLRELLKDKKVKKFKRVGWEEQLKELLGDNFYGIRTSHGEVEVLTEVELTDSEVKAVEKVLEARKYG